MNGNSRRQLFLDAWFALGVTLSTATQLYPRASVFNPGGALLALWLLSYVFRLRSGQFAPIHPTARKFIGFWIYSSLLLAVGTLVGFFTGLFDKDMGYHDMAAYLFIGMFVIVLVLGDGGSLLKKANLVLSFATVINLALIFLTVHFFRQGEPLAQLGSIQPMYELKFFRFEGLSANPDQCAFQLLPLPFIGMYFLGKAGNIRERLWYAVCVLVSLSAGVSTGSYALFVSWGVSFLILVCRVAYKTMTSSQARDFFENSVFRVKISPEYFLAATGFFVVLLLLKMHAYTWINEAYYADYGKGRARIIEWKLANAALARSPFFGLGPGAYSGDASNVMNSVHPFSHHEANNTFLDWTTNAGILGLFIYAWLLVEIMNNAWRRDLLFFCMVAAVICCSFFHDMLRHPVFWFYLIFAGMPEISHSFHDKPVQPAEVSR